MGRALQGPGRGQDRHPRPEPDPIPGCHRADSAEADRGPCRKYTLTGLDGHVNYILVMRNERDDLVAIGPVSIGYQAVVIRDEFEESLAGRRSGSPGY